MRDPRDAHQVERLPKGYPFTCEVPHCHAAATWCLVRTEGELAAAVARTIALAAGPLFAGQAIARVAYTCEDHRELIGADVVATADGPKLRAGGAA